MTQNNFSQPQNNGDKNAWSPRAAAKRGFEAPTMPMPNVASEASDASASQAAGATTPQSTPAGQTSIPVAKSKGLKSHGLLLGLAGGVAGLIVGGALMLGVHAATAGEVALASEQPQATIERLGGYGHDDFDFDFDDDAYGYGSRDAYGRDGGYGACPNFGYGEDGAYGRDGGYGACPGFGFDEDDADDYGYGERPERGYGQGEAYGYGERGGRGADQGMNGEKNGNDGTAGNGTEQRSDRGTQEQRGLENGTGENTGNAEREGRGIDRGTQEQRGNNAGSEQGAEAPKASAQAAAR